MISKCLLPCFRWPLKRNWASLSGPDLCLRNSRLIGGTLRRLSLTITSRTLSFLLDSASTTFKGTPKSSNSNPQSGTTQIKILSVLRWLLASNTWTQLSVKMWNRGLNDAMRMWVVSRSTLTKTCPLESKRSSCTIAKLRTKLPWLSQWALRNA